MIRPGRSISRFLRHRESAAARKPAFRRGLPIYFGDDLSDEAAFAAVHRGKSILAGKRRPTEARCQLRGPGEVRATVTRLRKVMR